jgi:cellulose synthase/poly-beta-1,6-N-acetylglucosamine synthase-like glycosyltransferase
VSETYSSPNLNGLVTAVPIGAQKQGRLTSMRVFAWWDYPIFGVISLLIVVSTANFVLHWMALDDFQTHTVVASALLFLLLANVGMIFSRWAMLPIMSRPEHMEAVPGLKVGVATTFVPNAESLNMLEQTVRGLVEMDYPHDTWVLDEGDDADVRAMCERLGAFHFSRKGIDRYQADEGRFAARTKHGNYNSWLDAIGFDRYDVIVNFDPDHVPRPEFLLRSIGYLRDPEIGYVQSAQAYYNQPASFVARGAAEETYSFYSSIQMTSFALGYPIAVGCHTAHRAEALRDVGGFAPHEADDLLITVYYRSHGWNGVYVPEILAFGLTPVDWTSYLTQQRRWARSTLDIKFRVFSQYAGRLSRIEQLIGWAHGLYYLHGLTKAFMIVALGFIVASGIQLSVISAESIPPFLFLMGSLYLPELYRQRYYLSPRNEVGLHLRAGILAAAKWPYVLLALLDVIFQRGVLYSLTAKSEQLQRAWPLLLPNALVILLVSASWFVGTQSGAIHQTGVLIYAANLIAGSILLIASHLLTFPPPFEDRNPRWLADRFREVR